MAVMFHDFVVVGLTCPRSMPLAMLTIKRSAPTVTGSLDNALRGILLAYVIMAHELLYHALQIW